MVEKLGYDFMIWKIFWCDITSYQGKKWWKRMRKKKSKCYLETLETWNFRTEHYIRVSHVAVTNCGNIPLQYILFLYEHVLQRDRVCIENNRVWRCSYFIQKKNLFHYYPFILKPYCSLMWWHLECITVLSTTLVTTFLFYFIFFFDLLKNSNRYSSANFVIWIWRKIEFLRFLLLLPDIYTWKFAKNGIREEDYTRLNKAHPRI